MATSSPIDRRRLAHPGRRLLLWFAWLCLALYGGIGTGAVSIDPCSVAEDGCDDDDCDPHGCPPLCAGTGCCHSALHVRFDPPVLASAPRQLSATHPPVGPGHSASFVCLDALFRPPRAS